MDLGAWVTVTRRVDCGASGLFDLYFCGASGEVLSRTTESRVCILLYELAIVLSYEWPCSLAVAAFSLVEH